MILEKEFRDSLQKINLTDDGNSWLTDKQVDDIVRDFLNQTGPGLLETNQNVFNLIKNYNCTF